MNQIIAILTLLFTLSACAPMAHIARDLLDTSDSASLRYVDQGLEFNSGEGVALDSSMSITGFEIVLLQVPSGIECTEEIPSQVYNCALGDVEGSVIINLSGLNVLSSVSYWRSEEIIPRVAYVR